MQNQHAQTAQKIARLRERIAGYAVIEKILKEPNLWQLDKNKVAGGVAVGLFVSWLPMPLQTLLAACLSRVMRVHVPVSMVMVWFTNPLTIVPLLYVAWMVGSTFLPTDHNTILLLSEAQQSGIHAFLDAFLAAWPVLLLGCIVCACLTSALGFLLVRLCWREPAYSGMDTR